MAKVLDTIVKDKIQRLYNNDFQNLVERILLIHYNHSFIPLKQKRDKGSDGIIESEKAILAVYGPEKRDLVSFKRKFREDCDKYKRHWEKDYPIWKVVYNMAFTASEIEFLDSLGVKVQKISPDHLMEIFNDLKWIDKKTISEFLGIEDVYFQHDALETILDDLIGETNKDASSIPHDPPIYILEKIEINYAKEEIETARDEHQDSMLYFSTIQQLLSDYSDQEQFALKNKLRTDYSAIFGSHSAKIERLTNQYGSRYHNNDLYKAFVKTILLYFFENCLIGKKTIAEKNQA